MDKSLDIITLRGLSAVGHHGVYEYERSGSQVFSADLTLFVDTHEAAATDDVQYTVDYSQIAEEAVKILTGTPVYLLETLATRLANKALQHPQVAAAEVTIHKPMAPVHHKFTDVSVTIKRYSQSAQGNKAAAASESAASQVILALGSNMGDTRATLTSAVAALMEVPGLEIDDVSPLAITRPVLAPGQPAQENYANAVVQARTILSPPKLLEATQSVEAQFGRTRDERWGSRTLDIDIIDYDQIVVDRDSLQLPHPRAKERAFVLYPWALMAPDAVFEGGQKVADLADRAEDLQGVIEVVRGWLHEPESVAPAQPEVLRVPPPPSRPNASIRGNNVSLEPLDGDHLFRNLMSKPSDPVVAAAPTPAPPQRRRQRQAAEPVSQLPEWRFGPSHDSVRIVDSTENAAASSEGPQQFAPRRAAARPRPTAAAVPRRRRGGEQPRQV